MARACRKPASLRLLLLAILLLAGLAPTLPGTALGAVPEAVDAAIRDWLALNHLTRAGVAVARDGTLVRSFDHGGWTAAQPLNIASLSKAITAVCIARLIDDGRLSFTTTLGSVLAPRFAELGEPVDPRLKSITIEQLLTHRSGTICASRRAAPFHGNARLTTP